MRCSTLQTSFSEEQTGTGADVLTAVTSMLRREVRYKFIDVSEERTAFTFRIDE
jgi:hypothetical protein